MDLNDRAPQDRRGTFGNAVAVLVFLVAASVLAWRMIDGISFLTFMDESAHVVGGKLLDAGGVLYRDFVDSHGPFIFMLAQAYGNLFGWTNPNHIRFIPIALCICAAVSVGWNAALHGLRPRMAALALFTFLLAAVWLRQGFYLFSFYSIAGATCCLLLTGYLVPVGLHQKPSTSRAFLCGFGLVSLVTIAYSFLPSALLFALAALLAEARRKWALLSGCAAGFLGALAYLGLFGDLRGYAAFHFAENQFVYSRYIFFSFALFRNSLILSVAPEARIHTLGLLCFIGAAVGLLILWRRRAEARLRRIVALGAMLSGVLLLNGRGATGFQDGTFVFASIGLVSVVFASLASNLSTPMVLLISAVAIWFSSGAIYAPQGLTNATVAQAPRYPIGTASDVPMFQLIRRAAKPNERILALTYNPRFYLLADRLPINGFYAYFKWDSDYARSPWFGRPHDLCSVLQTAPPPVIELDEAGTWGFPPRSYIPCLTSVLARLYQREDQLHSFEGDLYIRRDRADQLK